MDTPDIIILSVSIVAGLAVVVLLIFAVIEGKKEIQEMEKKRDLEFANLQEPETQFINAKVISKRIYKSYNYDKSIYMPEANLEYYITFLTDDGSTVEYSVSRETYEKTEENSQGTLVTVGGNFFDFGDGEEISDNDQQ